jgi:hypothetical protein
MENHNIELLLNYGGIKSMIEVAELLATSIGNDEDDIPPSYFDMLIGLYRKASESMREKLRTSYPNTTRQLDEFLQKD